MACHRVVPGGIVVCVRLTPRAARESVDGIGRLSDGREVVMARVRALPADGAANRALVALFARAMNLPKSAVRIAAGAGARLKQVEIDGDAHVLSAMIEAWPRIS